MSSVSALATEQLSMSRRNAATPAAKDERMDETAATWERFGKQMAEGERRVERREWKTARAAFRAALELIPDHSRARSRLEMCSRRLRPDLPGFRIVGEQFDQQTGLPRDVDVIGLGSRMLLVPPGEFDMGADALPDSRPVHTVRVDAFYLGRSEVTQSEWRSLMGDNPSVHQGQEFPNADRLPVECVSWNDCQEFLRRLNRRVTGGGFRLPTEAEWEYACRAGANQPKNEKLSERGWRRANSLRRIDSAAAVVRIDAYAPRPAGARRPNAWGLHDMQGNVWEWCSSLWRPLPYNANDGRESLDQAGLRVLRGGGFADSAELLRPAFRHSERPNRRFRWNGLRIARTAPAAAEQVSK
jgi:formylglycine-generating enzyme required for sulfatase activity